jgi:hypothetical protein
MEVEDDNTEKSRKYNLELDKVESNFEVVSLIRNISTKAAYFFQ